MATTDSLRPQPRHAQGAGPPTPAEISAAEAQAARDTNAELEELISAEIEAPLGPVAGKLAPLLEHQLRLRAREDVALRSPRELAADLESWSEKRLHALFAGMASGTARSLDAGVLEIERGHRERLEAALVSSGGSARPLIAALREVPLHPLPTFEPACAGSKRTRPPALRASLPGPLGRRLVRTAARARLRSALSRQAARLRAELAGLARDAVAGYRGELRARLEEVVG
jgi:hypothetical protein